MSDITRDYSFGGQLREIRISRGETLRSFAKRLGTDAANYCNLENGRISPPSSLEKCKRLLIKLEVPSDKIDWLLGQAYEHHLGILRGKWKSK